MKAYFFILASLCCATQLDARSITMHNRIEDKDTDVHKFGTHRPTPLIVRVGKSQQVIYKINGGTVEKNKQSMYATLEGDKLTVSFSYNIKGRKKDKELTYKVSPNVQNIELSFSWRNRPRITLTTNGNTQETDIEFLGVKESKFKGD